MLRLIVVSLIYILLFNPPILFFLNRICKKQFSPWWVALFSFLLGWFLCFPVGFLITIEELEEYGVEVWYLVILVSTTTGWLLSGVILLFWAPFITLFFAKSIKIKALMVTIIVASILSVTTVRIHNRNFWRVPGNRLIHEGSSRGILDGHRNRVFETENDLLKNKLICKWELEANQSGDPPTSFEAINKDKPEWWPSEDVLNSLEGYSWKDKSIRHYRSTWYDPNNKRLYVENGDT